MKARYVRVSTPDQNLERQLVKNHPDEELFIDVCSGSIPFDQRQLGSKLLSHQDLTQVSVHSIDRLGRNTLDVLTTLNKLTEAGVSVKVDNLGIESMVKGKPNQVFNLITSVLANVAEMERETMLERQREGIAIARANGKYKGRARGTADSPEDVISKYPQVVKLLKQKMSIRKTAILAEVSKSTVQKVVAATKTVQ